MLTLTQNILVVVATMAASLVFMVGLNRVWPVAKRHTENDLVGWQLNVLGTTYAVTLRFMLYTGWTNFNAAYLNAEMEANALRNIYRLAQGLPQQREQIETLARAPTPTLWSITIGRIWHKVDCPKRAMKSTRTCGRP